MERMDVPPQLIQAERYAMEAQLASLRKEVEEYEREVELSRDRGRWINRSVANPE